jgi:hypothetical protein
VRQNKDNRTSNVHQTNKKVQGHGKQNRIKMPRGRDGVFEHGNGVQCMRAEGNQKQPKSANNTTRRPGKKMQEVTMANENT